ncbi:hypothetical protein CDL15_Pgr027014 [Punica granatum]|uniref:Uncharacterized protein n=1 Tax=Punica granatum TaxID=22663 RepID=A0A218XW35_PUNGR|nr:hypothetical protein CDL15_Pgr027014 [Punica granatum]
MPRPCGEGFCFASCSMLKDWSSGVERLRIPSGRESESAVVLDVCSTCDPDITRYENVVATRKSSVLGHLSDS